MANTYDWRINQLDVRPLEDGLTDVIYNIHYSFIGTSETLNDNGEPLEVDIIGTQTIGSPNADDFTDFENLTKDVVVEWLESTIDLDELKASADKQLDKLVNPTSISKDVPF
jgi:hypothetical protein